MRFFPSISIVSEYEGMRDFRFLTENLRGVGVKAKTSSGVIVFTSIPERLIIDMIPEAAIKLSIMPKTR